ncbi:MAG: molecular chaperone DnaK, partial [Anaerolineaceae bacterium]|nr:molecular chaperone DnaK [Anaerolineaceae bacterium]
KDMGDKIPADQRSQVESKVKDLREAIQGDDKDKIKSLMDALQADLQAIGQAAYAQQDAAAGPQAGGAQAPSGEPSGSDEDVVEGEFHEA